MKNAPALRTNFSSSLFGAQLFFLFACSSEGGWRDAGALQRQQNAHGQLPLHSVQQRAPVRQQTHYA